MSCCARSWSTATTSTRTPKDLRRSKRWWRATPGDGGRTHRPDPEAIVLVARWLAPPRAYFRSTPGTEPVLAWHAQQRCHHSPPPGDRPDRQTQRFVSLTGQPNAMGGREVGGLFQPDVGAPRPCHPGTSRGNGAILTFPSCRRSRASWQSNCSAHREARRNQASVDRLHNPAQSMPDQGEIRAALEAAEFVVLQEAHGNTDTAKYADLLLPASPGRKGRHGHTPNGGSRAFALPSRRPARRAMTGRSPSISPIA